jgi:hypothetical protein
MSDKRGKSLKLLIKKECHSGTQRAYPLLDIWIPVSDQFGL